MFDKKATSVGVVAACLAYCGIIQPDKWVWLLGAMVCLAAAITGLNWLKNIETKRLHRLLINSVLLIVLAGPSLARATDDSFTTLQTGLGSSLGVVMLLGILLGAVMIMKALVGRDAGGEWKMELVKGGVMMGAPTFMNVLFQIFIHDNTIKGLNVSFAFPSG